MILIYLSSIVFYRPSFHWHWNFRNMISQLVYLPYDVPVLIAAASALLILYYLPVGLFSTLRDIKGPTLARYTRLWELYKNWQGQLEHVTVALHKQYGRSPHPTEICIY